MRSVLRATALRHSVLRLHAPATAYTSRAPDALYSRVMLPDDANNAGNVHGGTILKMIETVGHVAASKHSNSAGSDASLAAMASLDHMDFWAPMFIGEVATLGARLRFASERSVAVDVTVEATNITTGETRLTNQARCWYVAMPAAEYHGGEGKRGGCTRLVQMPPLRHLGDAERMEGERSYGAGKSEREQRSQRWRRCESALEDGGHAAGGAAARATTRLCQLMLPSDCTKNGIVLGGPVMKLMDSAAGIACARHCLTNVVTASLDALDFVDTVRVSTAPRRVAWRRVASRSSAHGLLSV
jgi:acyl-coenzyme A thioesterase 7